MHHARVRRTFAQLMRLQTRYAKPNNYLRLPCAGLVLSDTLLQRWHSLSAACNPPGAKRLGADALGI